MGQEIPTGAKLIAELDDLIRLDHDAIGAYTVAIERVESATYRETLEAFRADHERHVRELTRLVRANGGTPAEGPHTLTGPLKLAMQSLGAAAGSDRALLLAFKANEGETLRKYRAAARRPHAADVADVIRRAAADEERHYQWAMTRLERLGAGPDTVVGKVEAALEAEQAVTARLMEAAGRKASEIAQRAR